MTSLEVQSSNNRGGSVSATVIGCGHTAHLQIFPISFVIEAPHIHLHFLTSEDEFKELCYSKVEMCCHGCGASVLVYYRDTDNVDRQTQTRDEFTQLHSKCPNHNYQSTCPDWRTSTRIIDLRCRSTAWKPSPPTPKRRRSKKAICEPTTRARKTQ